jgi:hypothetical protein
MNHRGLISNLAIYAAVVSALLGCLGVSLVTLSGAILSQETKVRAKTPFEIQLERAREIRQALAKPILGPPPLPPITAKLEKPLPKLVALRPTSPKRNHEAAMRKARQVFASMSPSPPAQSYFGFMPLGGRR